MDIQDDSEVSSGPPDLDDVDVDDDVLNVFDDDDDSEDDFLIVEDDEKLEEEKTT